MGITYKLRTGVVEFILEAKKKDPGLSCRSLVSLVHDKFQIEVSKSSINAIIKSAGLSMPVGRRVKRRHKKAPGAIREAIKSAAESVMELYAPKTALPAPPEKQQLPSGPEKPVAQPEEESPREPIIELPQEPEAEEATPQPSAEAEKPTEEINPPAEITQSPVVPEQIIQQPTQEQPLSGEEPKPEEPKPEEPKPEEPKPEEPKPEEPKPTPEIITGLPGEPLSEKEIPPAVPEEPQAPEEEPQPVVPIEEGPQEPEKSILPEPAPEEVSSQQPPAEPEEPQVPPEETPPAEPAPTAPQEPAIEKEEPAETAPTPTEEHPVPESAPVAKQEAEILYFDQAKEVSGAVILKAADALLGGVLQIAANVKHHLNMEAPELVAKTEALLYGPLLGISLDDPLAAAENDHLLWPLINHQFSPQEIQVYLTGLEQNKIFNLDIFQVITRIFQEAKCIQAHLAEGDFFYLDGQLHTIWSAPQVPYDFSAPAYQLKKYFKDDYQSGLPLVLLAAPGFDVPTKELFDLILSMKDGKNMIKQLIIYDNKFENIGSLPISEAGRQFFIFGLWPWQFAQYRKIEALGEFMPVAFEPLKKQVFAAEGRIILSQPTLGQSVTLRICALKFSAEEKIKVAIATNLPPEEAELGQVINYYLNSWPNPQESFDNYSRKIVLFTYTANSRSFFSIEDLGQKRAILTQVKSMLTFYLQGLDLYARWHFLPSGYENKEFQLLRERFYDLKATLEPEKEWLRVRFQPPENYPYLNDLKYACARLNEKKVCFFGNKRAWFSL